MEGLEFRLRPGGPGRWFKAAFLGVWLCGWAAGEAFALWALVIGARALLTGEPPKPGAAPLEDQPWQFKLSYTWSLLHGNYPGLFSPDNGQLDPNINTQFDLPRLVVNRLGPLPDDHRHQLKFFGSYQIPRKWTGPHGITIGIGITAESGSPTTPLGADEDYQASEAFILPRGDGKTFVLPMAWPEPLEF